MNSRCRCADCWLRSDDQSRSKGEPVSAREGGARVTRPNRKPSRCCRCAPCCRGAVTRVNVRGRVSSWCCPCPRFCCHESAQTSAFGYSQAGHPSSFSAEGGESVKAAMRPRLGMARAESRRSDEEMRWPKSKVTCRWGCGKRWSCSEIHVIRQRFPTHPRSLKTTGESRRRCCGFWRGDS